MQKINAEQINARLLAIVEKFRTGENDPTHVVDLLANFAVIFTMSKTTEAFDVDEAFKVAHRDVVYETSQNDLEAVQCAIEEAMASLANHFRVPASAGE